MRIALQLLQAYVKCPTKCWLMSRHEPITDGGYAQWVQVQNEAYLTPAIQRLLSETRHAECIISPSADNLKAGKWRLAANVLARAQRLESHVHAVERVPSEGRGKPAQYSPVRFVPNNRLDKDTKLLLAFDALALAEVLGEKVSLGKIIHGDGHTTVRVRIPALAGEVQKHLEEMTTLLSNPSPPDLFLIRHCSECEFQTRCRQKAVERDDLSLLSGMTVKERKRLHSKVIFTVTQLSYTFRPRRRPKRMRDKREKYHHSLKALAIRENKIHIVGSPELKVEGTPVYLYVEGLPDRDFYYLIGLRIGNGDSAVQHSLWADTVEDEGKIWREFLAILETVEKPVLIHYGSYETDFLKRMHERHGEPTQSSVAAKTNPPAVNLVSLIFAQVYFPTFSNGLKEIAGYLGFRWSDSDTTGAQTIGWRHKWAASREPCQKSSLLLYNAEDCEAVEAMTYKLIELHRDPAEAGGLPSKEVVDTTKMKWEHPYGFKRNTFAYPELNTINNAAYWDYQRERIYVKSNVNLKRALTRPPKSRTGLPPNKTIECPRPRTCPKCASAQFVKHTKYSKTVFDLKFIRHGIKRWITRYRFHRYLCQNCGAVFQPKETCWGKGKFGSEIVAYA